MSSFFIVLKYKLKENFKILFLILFSSIVALSITFVLINLNMNKSLLNDSIENSFLETYTSKIYKYTNEIEDNNFSILSYEKPSIKEICNFNVPKNKLYINLDFLFNSAKLYEGDSQVFDNVSFFPYLNSYSNSCIANFEINNAYVSLNYDYQYENEIININKNIKISKIIDEFNFLPTKTIYYPINYINSLLMNLYVNEEKSIYEDLISLNSNHEKTGYSIYAFLNKEQYNLLSKNDKFNNKYFLENNNIDLKNSFIDIYNSLLDFSLIFLFLILIINFFLIVFSLNNILNKNRKDIAILKSYGYDNLFFKMIYYSEILLIMILSIVFSKLIGTILSNCLVLYFKKYLLINLSFLNNSYFTNLFIFIYVMINLILLSITITRINKINLKDELNAL